MTLGLVLTVGLAQFASGCVAHAGLGGEVVVADPSPSVVFVSPGIWVVENHHEAVFYSDNFYWQRRGGVWDRSSYYNDGFVVVHARAVPRGIYGVRSHRGYVRYRARSNARRARAVRRHNRANRRNNRARNRDYRRARKRDTRRNNRDYRRARKRDNRRNNRARKRDNRARKRDNRDYRKRQKKAKKNKRKNKKRKNHRDYRSR